MQFILGTEDDDEHIPHDLFTEMDELCFRDGEEYEWRETARYVWSRLFQDMTYRKNFLKELQTRFDLESSLSVGVVYSIHAQQTKTLVLLVQH